MHRTLSILVALLALAACSRSGSGPAATEVGQEALLEQLASASPPLVLDVRTPEEFVSGHVPGAQNVPIDELAARIGDLSADRDREVVVYCERGPRARRAQAALVDAGFAQVRHLEGDMSSWRDAKRPCDGC